MSHVFIVQGDLTRLRSDAWLLPSDRAFHIMGYWLTADVRDAFIRLNTRQFSADIESTDAWESEAKRVMPLEGWPGHSQAFIANVGGSATHPVEWYLEALRQFVEAAKDVESQRDRPLLALPAIGTGYGGHWHKKAAVIDGLVREAYALAVDHRVDICLVALDLPIFAAAQATRRAMLSEKGSLWPELEAPLVEKTIELGGRARNGELVLFLGAGVSAGAGLPLWHQLLEKLAKRGGSSPEERKAMAKLDSMDRGLLVERKLGGRDELEAAIRDELSSPCHSLAHAQLAGLPTDSIVTLNYDRLFEMAARATHPVAVLPSERGSGARRWLLKLHGCIEHGGLVLTREDYLRFGDRRAALAGIVQALLLTRHMLFVGFGMTDLNFLRILDDVRKAVGDDSEGRDLEESFGTVLTLRPEPLRDSIWGEDLDICSVTDSPNAETPDGARKLEIFLDRLLFEAGTSPAYLMDSTFEAMLTNTQVEFRDELEKLYRRFHLDLAGSTEWSQFERLLESLGGERLND